MTNWQVIYFNEVTEQWHTLIDNIDEETAEKVCTNFGPYAPNPYNRLPAVKKEPMQ